MTPSDSHPAPVPEHVAELRRRWEEDPGSRLFLQLAEEYRRLGRHGEAVRVLETGLDRHPSQVSAHVALGRARLEAGDAAGAVEVLDRALGLDPTNLVANKLLVEAHLARGDRDLARQRLDLYLLLNEGDPQADELRRRVGRGGGPGDGDATADARSAPAPEAAGPDGDEGGADLGWDAGWIAEEAAGPQAAASTAADASASTDGRGEPFGELGGPRARRRYLAALGAAGIFPIEAPPETPEAAAAGGEPGAAPFGEPFAVGREPAKPSPAAGEAAPEASAAEEPVEPAVPAAAATPAEDREPTREPTPERPTVTLGELYLAQGHPREAERIFGRVLERAPDDAAAAEGLERARAAAARRAAAPAGSLTARELLDEAAPDAPPRVALLNAYLARLRRGSRGGGADRTGRAGRA